MTDILIYPVPVGVAPGGDRRAAGDDYFEYDNRNDFIFYIYKKNYKV